MLRCLRHLFICLFLFFSHLFIFWAGRGVICLLFAAFAGMHRHFIVGVFVFSCSPSLSLRRSLCFNDPFQLYSSFTNHPSRTSSRYFSTSVDCNRMLLACATRTAVIVLCVICHRQQLADLTCWSSSSSSSSSSPSLLRLDAASGCGGPVTCWSS